VVILRIVVSLLLFALLSAAATREPARTRRAMVVSTEKHATEIGVEVLRKGGNAVDAAVAVGFALSVTHPAAGSLGGGGFMLIRLANGRSTFIDFRERAPAAATRTMYLDSQGKPTGESVLGYRASGVPGSCRGYALALEKYGTWRWPKVVEPAIRLASEGFAVTYEFAQDLRDNQRLPQFPESKRIFLRNGDYLEQGDVLRQRDLAATLKRIAKKGPDEFYTGENAMKGPLPAGIVTEAKKRLEKAGAIVEPLIAQ
jgi:gamma-glutamyltranspeptidase/glutathione hydrolase